MNSLTSDRFSYKFNGSNHANTGSKANNEKSTTPRRTFKINALLNHENESSANVFPLFSDFNTKSVADASNNISKTAFHSSTTATNNNLILHRPITPFTEDGLSRSTTPIQQITRPLTPVSSINSVFSRSPCSRSLLGTPSIQTGLQTPKSPDTPERYISLEEPISFESHTGVLDFRPLKLKLINTSSSESKLLNFDLSPTSGNATGEASSKSVHFYTSRFISNPSIFKNRKFQCKVCDKRFKTTGHLTRHKKIHSGEKKFPCSWEGCNSKFSRKDNCMQHYRTHLTNKRHKVNPKLGLQAAPIIKRSFN